jgi:hypothetical protein
MWSSFFFFFSSPLQLQGVAAMRTVQGIELMM